MFLSLLLSEFDGEKLQASNFNDDNDDDDDEEEKNLQIAWNRISRFLEYLRQQLCCCFPKKRNKKRRNQDLKQNGLEKYLLSI